MNEQRKMEQIVLNFFKKGPDEDGVFRMEEEEAKAIVQMIYAMYNKVNQLCSAMYRQEHEKNSGVPDNSRPWL